MALPYLEIRDTNNNPITSLDFGTVLAGEYSEVKELRIWNDYGGAYNSDEAINVGLKVLNEDGEEEGELVQDGWIEYKIGSTGDTAYPLIIETAWKPIRKNQYPELSSIQQNTYRTIYLRLRSPLGAATSTFEFLFSLFYGAYISYVDELTAELSGDGIVSFQGNKDVNGFRWGFEISTNDSSIDITEGEAIFSGRPLITDATQIVLNQEDGDGETLVSGESYIAVISLKNDGTFTVTKGNKGTTPEVPDCPVNELKVAEAQVFYSSGIDITNYVTYFEFGAKPVSINDFEIGYGDALIETTYIELSSKSSVGLEDNSINYIYLDSMGIISCVTGEAEGLLLYKVVVSGGEIVKVYDRRKFIESENRLVIEVFNNSGGDLDKGGVAKWNGNLEVSYAGEGETKWAGVLLQDIPQDEYGYVCAKGVALANVSGANINDFLVANSGYLTASTSPNALSVVAIAQTTVSSGIKKIYVVI